MKLINFIIKSMCGFSILISFASCDDFLNAYRIEHLYIDNHGRYGTADEFSVPSEQLRQKYP